MNCNHGNKKECDRMRKEEPLVQKGLGRNQANQIQGGSLSTPELAYSPFMIFMNEYREKCPFENNFCGIACRQKWKPMTFAERAPYVAKTEKRMAENISKYDELKHKCDESSSERSEEESAGEEEDDEECSEEENDEESSEKEEDEESDESNSESNDEDSDDKEDGKKMDEEVGDDDNDESCFESNANDNDDDGEIVFVNSEPDMLKSPTYDPCIIWQGEDGGFELITADAGCGEQFHASDLSEMISKPETSAISEDDVDVDETGMPAQDIELVMTLAKIQDLRE